MRCEWCGITVRILINNNNSIISFLFIQTHSTCRSRVPEECGFGTLRDIIIPPYAISIPRVADLNKDLILGIGNNMLKPIQNFSNNNSNTQSSDYVIVGQPSTPDPKSPGSFSK
jgi:diacylglycerol kinase (ATP)